MIAELPGTWLRLLFVLAFALVGLMAQAGNAEASGCHVAERPIFGIDPHPKAQRGPSLDLQEPILSSLPDLRHAPCPGEIPGSVSKFEIQQLPLLETHRLAPRRSVEFRRINASDAPRFLPIFEELDRPPRSYPILLAV